MSGKRVPGSGSNIYLKTDPVNTSRAIFEVFGTPAGGNLNGLRGSNYDDGARPPPFTTGAILTVPATGDLNMRLFQDKAPFMTSPTAATITALSTGSVIPSFTAGTSNFIAIGSTSGATDTTGGWVPATSGTAIIKKKDGTTALSLTDGSPYYISRYDSNDTNKTASLAVSNATAYGIPNAATSPILTLTTLTNWSISWTAATGSILPTSYQARLNKTSDNTNVSGINADASATDIGTQTTTLSKDTDYYAVIYSIRNEANTASAWSVSKQLAGPAAPTFSSSSISNTTFTAVASSSTSGSTMSYTISPSATQSSTGVFTGLSQNTDYTVTAIATLTNGTSTSATSTRRCLGPATDIVMDLVATTGSNVQVKSWVGVVGGSYTVVMSNATSAYSTTGATTGISFSPSSTNAAGTYQSNSVITVTINVVGTNSIFTTSNVYFATVTTGATVFPFTLSATRSVSYYVQGGAGGSPSGNFGGWGAGISGSLSLSADTYSIFTGGKGDASGFETNVTANGGQCGNNSKALGGGSARHAMYGVGGGGAASALFSSAGTALLIAGGGGGGFGGFANGGAGGVGPSGAGTRGGGGSNGGYGSIGGGYGANPGANGGGYGQVYPNSLYPTAAGIGGGGGQGGGGGSGYGGGGGGSALGGGGGGGSLIPTGGTCAQGGIFDKGWAFVSYSS